MIIRRKLALVMGSAFVALLFFAAAAHAAESHPKRVFDPAISLRGDCTTSTLDEVRDPGPCPGVAGVDHPLKSLSQPCGVAVDPHGDIYVASPAIESTVEKSTGGRIDIFGPDGEYITEIKDPNEPCDLAVDSKGNVYVAEFATLDAVLYASSDYPPTKDTTFGPRTVLVAHTFGAPCPSAEGVAVDHSNDHLYVALGCEIAEYDAAANGSAPIAGHEKIGFGLGSNLNHLDVCGDGHDVYATGRIPTAVSPGDPVNSRVFVFDGGDGHVKREIDGSDTPEGGFGFSFGQAEVAVDQADCSIYVDDISMNEVVDQFDSEGHYASQLKHSFTGGGVPQPGLAVDDPTAGEPGYDSPNETEVYVAQGKNSSTSHLYAFKLTNAGPPEIEGQAAAGITETEAIFSASLNPGGLDIFYRFEYITQAAYEADGNDFGPGAASVPAPDAAAGAGGSFVSVSEAIGGLLPGTRYRFRLVADNCAAEDAIPGECRSEGEGKPGEEGADATFATYRPEAGLPDGRRYELVTPPETNGLIPTMSVLGNISDSNFATPLASPDGKSIVFGAEGGSIPALGGGGYHDTYEATRGEGGWQSRFNGIAAAGAEAPFPGGISPDHRYAFWFVNEQGSGNMPRGNYLRLPDGGFQPVGLGSLGQDVNAVGRLITAGAGHVVFETNHALGAKTIKLEPNAPPTGTATVYDRTPNGQTHVVSLLPGVEPDGITPSAGLDSDFQGASADGAVVAFKTLSSPGESQTTAPLYARVENAETLKIASGETVFGGISDDGRRVAYLRPNTSQGQRPNPIVPGAPGPPQGGIFVYDTGAKTTTAVGSGDESVLVNVSPDGSRVYFDSPLESPHGLVGAKGEPGAENLYAWDANTESVRLVATLTQRDLLGQQTPGVTADMTDGLGLWIQDVVVPDKGSTAGPGDDPSRTSADGTVMIFESRARLTEYENDGRAEIYRYDADSSAAERIDCLSCNPTGIAAGSDTKLQSLPAPILVSLPPVNSLAEVVNLTPDGRRAFFQTADPLTVADNDERVDVYEWEAPGTGGCEREGGCTQLISGGHSAGDDYLYAISSDGSNVFFLSGDMLVPQDGDSTPSIYDARVEGGFAGPRPAPDECVGEACQPAATAPNDAIPASSSFEGPGNRPSRAGRRCAKGKLKVRHAGRTRCMTHPQKHHKKPTSRRSVSR